MVKPAKLPAIWRKRKKGGKYAGNYVTKIKGTEVNLGTKVLEGEDGANARLLQAMNGKCSFRDDVDRAAEMLDRAPPPAPLPAAAAVPSTPPPAPVPPAIPAAAPPVVPDAILPSAPRPPALLGPISSEAQAEEQATRDAAAETVGDDAGGAAGDMPEMDPDVLDTMLTQGGELLVDVQLQLQAYIIKRRSGKIAGEIPLDSKIRKMAAAAWVSQLKIWFPADTMVSPWMVAIMVPLMAMPLQMAKATDPPTDATEAGAAGDERPDISPAAA